MYRKLRDSESLKEFIKEAVDDILKRLEAMEENGTENPDRDLFNSFVRKLSKEDIVLSENLVKLAVAEKTKDEADQYEYNPVIRFAINHLRALEIIGL